jgi:minor extracellular serine protease Vpr
MRGVSSVTVALVLAMTAIAATNTYLYMTQVTEKQEIPETTTTPEPITSTVPTIIPETTTTTIISGVITTTPEVTTTIMTSTTTTPGVKGLIEELQPKINGYIVQLKETPILKKKLEIEKINQIAVTKIEEFPSRLEDQKSRITSEHQTFLTKASTVLEYPEEKVIREFKVAFNGIVLNISVSEAEELKKFEEVKEVYPNREVKALLLDSVPLINADDVWNLGYTGEGIKIAILDTGIDYTHPDLGGCFGSECRVVDGIDFVNNDFDPMDDHGHGTHCAGIAAGNGTLKGVAPDAKLLAYKVLNSDGSGWTLDVISGIERATDPNNDGDYSDHVDIMSISIGSLGDPDDPASQAVDTAVENGIIVVVAAGNSGPSGNTDCRHDGDGSSNSICSPGTATKAITVGASDKNDDLASFSSRGPTSIGTMKPDVVAPGVNICSSQWDDFRPDKECVDDNHTSMKGTSMATPHVAGAVALIKQAHPDWTPEMVKSALFETAIDLGYTVYEQGGGRIDVYNAIMWSSTTTTTVMTTTTLSTTTIISSDCPGDLTNDREVNVLDLIIPGSAFGSTPEDPNWNPVADTDGSNKIDILDLIYVGKNLGIVCQ